MDGCKVYRGTRGVPRTLSLVRGCNYGSVCQHSAVPMLMQEVGVRLTPLNSEPKVG